MTVPNFLVIGTAKAGTTSLHDYLAQHPQIFVSPRREPSYFAHAGAQPRYNGPGDRDWKFVVEWAEYLQLFAAASEHSAVGEISPRYLYFADASRRIQEKIPHTRLIAILRHPVDRAYSHFLMNRARDCEPFANFSEAMELEAGRLALGWGWDWCYVGAGLYHTQLSRYFEKFPKKQIKVLFYDDYKKDSFLFLESLFNFLGVDPTYRPDMNVRHREAGLPRSHRLRRALEHRGPLRRLARNALPAAWRHRAKEEMLARNTVRPPPLADELRRRLFDRHFAEDYQRLRALLGCDLPDWSAPKQRTG